MKNVIILIMIFIFSSCTSIKKINRTKSNKIDSTKIRTKEIETRIKYDKKDSIIYVPNLIIKNKDTVITLKNKKQKLSISYNNGKISSIKCLRNEIAELIKIQREIIQQNNIKYNTENENINRETKPNNMNVLLIYIFIGLIVLIFVNKFVS